MAKNRGDVILRDRMQFDLSGAGDRTTLYGRIDLSSYVDPVNKQGLAIKEVFFQLRNPNTTGTLDNTGGYVPVGNVTSGSETAGAPSCIKLYATTRAYENAAEVGIASPDVLCVYERYSFAFPAGYDAGALAGGQSGITENLWYGPRDLHPAGYTVVSDLLIGVAADGWDTEDDETIEIDIVLIAEPVSISTERMNEILSQAQDL